MRYSFLFVMAFALGMFNSCGNSGNAEVETPTTTDQTEASAATSENTGSDENPSGTLPPEPLNMQQAELQNKLRGYSGNISAVPVLSAEQIKDLMPDKLAGLFIYENEGETTAALGDPATFVVTIYRENYNIIKVAVTDTGGSPSVILATAQWSNQNINNNNGNGFDRTTTYKSYPAHEQYNEKSKVGMFEYIIDHRFVISCQGKNVSVEKMKEAMDELNLDRLKRLQPS